MNISLDLNLKNESLVGAKTDDPLCYGFVSKKGAHAGGRSLPVNSETAQAVLHEKFADPDIRATDRCLYIHIPFCRVRCTFCNFFQYASGRDLINNYFSALMAEIKWKADMSWTQAAPFHAVYVGGGTPTDLSADQLKILGNAIREYFWLTPDCEITLEGRVNRFSDESFERALEGGFNRFSFGVQSFNTQVRKSAKRLDDREHVLERISQLARDNRAPIVLDLLFGLPYQSLEIWQQDLEDYLISGAHGVDLYQLIEMPGQPMAGMIEKGRLPRAGDTPLKAKMFEAGVNFMDQHHQRRLSVNHWASSNRERSVYNSLAKTSAEVLPIGAGAGGNIGGVAMMQHRDMNKYIEWVSAKEFPVPMLFRQSQTSGINAVVKSAFDRGVLSKKVLNNAHGQNLFSALRPLFEKWEENGFVKRESSYITLTTAGQFWSVTLAQNLIQVIEDNNIIIRAA